MEVPTERERIKEGGGSLAELAAAQQCLPPGFTRVDLLHTHLDCSIPLSWFKWAEQIVVVII